MGPMLADMGLGPMGPMGPKWPIICCQGPMGPIPPILLFGNFEMNYNFLGPRPHGAHGAHMADIIRLDFDKNLDNKNKNVGFGN